MRRGSRRSASGNLHFRQASGRSDIIGHANSSVASMQDGDSSLYCEISSMEGSGDTCAIVCISGSGKFRRPIAPTQMLKSL